MRFYRATLLALAAVALILGASWLRHSRSVAPPAGHRPAASGASEDPPRAERAEASGIHGVRVEKLGSVSPREVFDLLHSCSGAELAELARDLQTLRPGAQTDAAVEQFYKAWGELDAHAALQTALAVRDFSMKRSRSEQS